MIDRLRDSLELLKKNNVNLAFIIILGGTNDLGVEQPDTVFDNLKKLYEMAEGTGAKVVTMTIPESSFNISWYLSKRKDINSKIQKISSERNYTIIDVESLIPYDAGIYWNDSLHFSPEGYDKLGEVIFSGIDKNINTFLEAKRL